MEYNLSKLTPDVRQLAELQNVVYDKEWFKTAQDFVLYKMYRKLKIENGLRYDITVISPGMLGQEFIKTKGHIHAGFYGEVYMVLEGEGIYFAQKSASAKASAGQGDNENNIEDVFAVFAKKGDVIIIPAGYGHVTINPGNQELKTANWVAESDKGNFEPFERNQGACYYFIDVTDVGRPAGRPTSTLSVQGVWVKNEHYKNVPPLRFEEPLKEVPKNLDFLKAK